MAPIKKYKFEPDYLVPPGTTLREVLEARGMSQADLSIRAGLTEKTVSQIINGIAPISVETADRLELVLGVPANFWNARELAYRESLTRSEETDKLTSDISWLKEIPVKELIQREYVEPTKDKTVLVRRVLQFFGVSSVENWRALVRNRGIQFRGKKANERKPGFVAAWRRLGVLKALEVETEPFDAQKFKKSLVAARKLIAGPPDKWISGLTKVCAPAGVAFVLVKEMPGASVSGLARWLTPEKAVIQVSLKYKTEDHFWFTFFHEAGHILLHSKKNVFVDYDCEEYSESQEIERDANIFAREWLIPSRYVHRFPQLTNRPRIKQFAKDIDVTPGIVVGRLQHDHVLRQTSVLRKLKIPFEWEK